MTPVRLGAVAYLNARPLVHGLESSGRFSVRFDVPSRCAALLADGAIDIGLIPAAEYRADQYAAVPGICIGSSGPVASVALFSQKPVEAVRTVALDASSRTSAALVRILCVERWGIAPAFSTAAPDLPAMLRHADAALLIGDPALEAEPERLGTLKIDLGAEWTSLTALPFVWALWAGPDTAVSVDVCLALQAARNAGCAAIEAIAEEYAGGDPRRYRTAVDYLGTNIQYDLDGPHIEGLERFMASAAKIGMAPAGGRVRLARSGTAARA